MKKSDVSQFMKQILEEDFASARESLQQIINEKMKARISAAYDDLKEKK